MSVTPRVFMTPMFFLTTPYQSPPPARHDSQLKPCSNTTLLKSAAAMISFMFARRLPLGIRRCTSLSFSRSSASICALWALQSDSKSSTSTSIKLGVRLISVLSIPSFPMQRWRLDFLGIDKGPDEWENEPMPKARLVCRPTIFLSSPTWSADSPASSPSSAAASPLAPPADAFSFAASPIAAAAAAFFVRMVTSGSPQTQDTVTCACLPLLFGTSNDWFSPPAHVAASGALPSAFWIRTLNSTCSQSAGSTRDSEAQSGKTFGVVARGNAPCGDQLPSWGTEPQTKTASSGFVDGHCT
mmetsp:Transcript_121157/g.348072  ORF Transcript_121157/g.348072 Transcript_121157/m.348072 type:complete len:299 (-) Transcript_121157:59-955(-)